MAKKGASEFVCQSCGAVYPKWQGKCDACGEWNTIVEEKSGGEGFSNIAPKRKGRQLEFVPLSGSQEALTDRKSTRLNSSHTRPSRMPSSA